MLRLPGLSRKMSLLVNCLGLSCIGSALFLESLVISGLLQNGYFRGIEQNPIILWLEAGLTGIGIAYFGYLYARFIASQR